MTDVTVKEIPLFDVWQNAFQRAGIPNVRSATRSYRATVRLDHVVIAVSDFERSNAFYRDVLGAELVETDGRVAYRFAGQQLNVHGPGTRPAMVARIPVTPGSSDLCFEWNGAIEGAIEHLRSHGVPVEAGPMTRGGAKGRGTSVYFRDPDGTLLELISYID
jgi:catechol 2,3-dioxygenase-like lactoylglutathione lyase family enzyme